MKKTWICLGVCAVLTACGGGGDDNSGATANSGGTSGVTSGSTGGSTGGTAATAQPLAAQQTYIGSVSFGDTISVQIDAPAKGQVTTTFVSSQFGLSGKLVGSYTVTNGNYVVSGFQASGTVPATLSAGASAVGMQFTVSADAANHGVLSGQLSNVPNVSAGSGLLAGQVSASNNGVTTVAGLAGTYSFIKLSGDYSSNGVPVGTQDVNSGQMRINADGSLRVCLGAPYSNTCMDDENPNVADTGTVSVDPDQTTYPGAFDMSVNGLPLGRMFVSTSGGNNTILLDQANVNSSGTVRTGSWVLQTTAALTSGSYDGRWVCSEPNTNDNDQLLGNIIASTVTISGTTLTPSGTSASPMTLNLNSTFNAAASTTTPTYAAGVNGLMAGLLPNVSNGKQVQSTMVFLPVSSTNIYYTDEPNGDGFFVQGLCTKQPNPA
ncbi:hypothetical protein [Burkholderia sp. 22PA0106]|uniref:hypothetical protein n=1 Tax=Burkholderia sp. 22PA0106 TaxID=3237371 RepID=UPI0039C26390